MDAPSLDSKVTETTHSGWSVVKHAEPASMPATPTVKVKGKEMLDGTDFSRSGGEFTWSKPLSVHCEVEVYDGASLEWRWSPIEGDLVGGP